jgi:ferrous iron transport protein B
MKQEATLQPQIPSASLTASGPELRPVVLAIAGNPNSGKTTLFNCLTGLRQKVANYAGVTVERKIGVVKSDGREVCLIDLPGTYALTPKSEEQRIAAEVILGLNKEVPPPDGVLVVVDSTCLEKSLYLVLQVLGTGIPTAVLLNMRDELDLRGGSIDAEALSRLLGAAVLSISATQGIGLPELQELILGWTPSPRNSFKPLPVVPRLEDVAQLRTQAREIAAEVIEKYPRGHPWSDRVDGVVLHKLWGPPIFAVVVMVVFQSIFSWAKPLMDLIDGAFTALGLVVHHALHVPLLSSFLADGVVAGVGSVIVFLPQILIVFFFIAILENSGYLARAALVMDHLLSKIGLQGKSFLPLISSYACAVPGIMAARTIENKRDRLATIFVAPFMTCSARLPVYALLIGAFVPDVPVVGRWVRLRAMTLLGLYVAGFLAALVTAWALKSTILKSVRTPFLLELPPYRLPQLKTVLLLMWERAKVFLRQAGTVILGISMLLWFLASFPRSPVSGPEAVRNSFAGRIGVFIEPVIRPLGFNWKIGVGLISAQAAREVMVSTLAEIYRVENRKGEGENLQKALQSDMSPLSAVSLMIFFAFAMQCMSTLAVARRETGRWLVPVIMFFYMNGVAYAASLGVYQIGRLLGFGG